MACSSSRWNLASLAVNLSSAPARITRRQARRGNSRQRTALSLRAGQLHEAAAVAPADVLSTCTALAASLPGLALQTCHEPRNFVPLFDVLHRIARSQGSDEGRRVDE